MYWSAGRPKSRLENRWVECLFLGVQDRSDEVVIGTREGAFKITNREVVGWSEGRG